MTDIEELDIARTINEYQYISGTGLYDRERKALHRLVDRGLVHDDLTSARRFTLTNAGHVWLAQQED